MTRAAPDADSVPAVAAPSTSAETTTTEAAPASGLRGKLGVGAIVFMVIAASAPLTAIGGALPVAFGASGSTGMPAAFVIVMVVLLLFSVGYAAMSQHVANAGAFYAYIARGLGKPLGLGSSFLAVLSYTAIQAGIYGLYGATIKGVVIQYDGPDLPWWSYSIATAVVVGILGYLNIELGAKVLGLLLVLEVVAIAVLDVAVLAKGGADGVTVDSFNPNTLTGNGSSIGIALMFAVASFIGFEATAIFSEEAKKPARTVPIATYVAVVAIGVFYAISAWAIVLAFGDDKTLGVATAPDGSGAGMVFGAASEYVGGAWDDVMNVLLCTSLIAALLAFHNAIARYQYALGREGVLPKLMARSHPRFGSPSVSSIVQTVTAIVILLAFVAFKKDPILHLFSWMSGVATVGILILMALTCLAVIVFFRRSTVDRRPWQTLIAPALGLVGLVVIDALVIDNFSLLIGDTGKGLTYFFEALIVAVVVVGVILALVFRAVRPSTYQKLGTFSAIKD